jgi:hypothetical protein
VIHLKKMTFPGGLGHTRISSATANEKVVPELQIDRGKRVPQQRPHLLNPIGWNLAAWVISLACVANSGNVSDVHDVIQNQ